MIDEKFILALSFVFILCKFFKLMNYTKQLEEQVKTLQEQVQTSEPTEQN